MAKKKGSSCLLGCGIGCLVLLLATIALFAGGAVWFKSLLGGFEQAVETRDALEEEFGDASEYTPPADGAIAADRVEAFLAIRAATAEHRASIRGFFDKLPMSEEEEREIEAQPFGEKLGTVLGITSSALGLAGNIGDFYVARNSAFSRHRMGLGEYSYIYVLAYYSWLGKSPRDGPGTDEDGGHDIERSLSRVRRNLVSQLENQLASTAGDGPEVAPGPAGRALRAEIEALRANRERVPWQDGLPPAIEASLAPFRARLEAAYEPTTNPFELARMERRNNFSFEVD